MKKTFFVSGLIMIVLLAPAICRAENNKAQAKDEQVSSSSMQAMSAEFMKKVMEASARIEAMKKDITEREKYLYETNPEIKAMRSQIMELQNSINRILDEDKELSALKMDRDISWSLMPDLPRPASERPMPPGFIKNR